MTRLEQYEFALQNLQNFAQEANDSPRVIEAFGMALASDPDGAGGAAGASGARW